LTSYRLTYLSDNIVVAGRLETLVEVALQSFDHVLAIFVTLQVTEEGLAVLLVSDEFGETEIEHEGCGDDDVDDDDDDAQGNVDSWDIRSRNCSRTTNLRRCWSYIATVLTHRAMLSFPRPNAYG